MAAVDYDRYRVGDRRRHPANVSDETAAGNIRATSSYSNHIIGKGDT